MPQLSKKFNSSGSCPQTAPVPEHHESRMIWIAVGHDSWIFFNNSSWRHHRMQTIFCSTNPSYHCCCCCHTDHQIDPSGIVRRHFCFIIATHQFSIRETPLRPLAKRPTIEWMTDREQDYGSRFGLVQVTTGICIVRQIFEHLHRVAVLHLWFAYYWFRIGIRYTPWQVGTL